MVKEVYKRLFCFSCVFMLVLSTVRFSQSAETTPLRKLRVAITSLSGSMAVPWLAREAGIFKSMAEVEVMPTERRRGHERADRRRITFLQIAGAPRPARPSAALMSW
jgi:hypothetical protein